MIHFDAVDFSERRPEEVISFFWRSVYMLWLFFPSKGISFEFRNKGYLEKFVYDCKLSVIETLLLWLLQIQTIHVYFLCLFM